MAGKRDRYYRIRNGKVYARITFTDETGKRRDLMRLADDKVHARELAAQMLAEVRNHGVEMLDADRITFDKLADAYIEARLQPAHYHKGRKTSGIRSWKTPRGHVAVLKEFFGRKRIKAITPADLQKLKAQRLQVKTWRGDERSHATVNRELEQLRAMMNFAKHQGWLTVSPFERCKCIISHADEIKRDRVFTRAEEARLLEACTGQREHLRPIILTAIDCGLRRGEILKLRWNDVDLVGRTITVIAENAKTARERTVGITSRLLVELTRLHAESGGRPDDLVFGLANTFKKAWMNAVKAAGLTDARFHDLRHCFVSRLVAQGLSIAEIMRLSGHSTLAAFAVYANKTQDTVRRGADALDAYHQQNSVQPVNEMVN